LRTGLPARPGQGILSPDGMGAQMVGRILASEDCMAEGAAWLAAREPGFARALEQCGPPPLRRRDDGFAALLGAIVSQQVSTAAARAIWARMEAAGLHRPPAILAAADEDLRAAGLSRQKIRYARALAGAGIEFDALRTAPEDEIVATLTALPGIGRWTAEIYAMFSLGRADVFAPADLALQESARILFDLPERPREAALRRMAEPWSPWRAVAARLLWAYYHVAKDREGIA
jgi:DNA-3-methyladenine glycosylase II